MLREGLTAEASGACARRFLYPEPRIRTGTAPRPEPRRQRLRRSERRPGRWRPAARRAERSRRRHRRRDACPSSRRPGHGSTGRHRTPCTPRITGGDDYELLFTVRPRTRGRLKAAMRPGDTPLTRIGVCTADRGGRAARTEEPGTGRCRPDTATSDDSSHQSAASGGGWARCCTSTTPRSAPRPPSRSASSSDSPRSSVSTRFWASPSRSC